MDAGRWWPAHSARMDAGGVMVAGMPHARTLCPLMDAGRWWPAHSARMDAGKHFFLKRGLTRRASCVILRRVVMRKAPPAMG